MSNPDKPKRAYEEVAHHVRLMLSAGELKMGDRLPAERVLSKQLRVSRSALREALRTLEMSGLLEMKMGKSGGAFISNGNAKKVASSMADLLRLGDISLAHLTEARLLIENVVVRVACERATESDYLALEANAKAASDLFDKGMMSEKTDMNIEFHNALARATRNPVLILMMETLTDVLRAFAHELGSETTRTGLHSRKRFLKAMRARDTQAAVHEMERNLTRVHRHYLKLAAQGNVDKRTPQARSIVTKTVPA